MTAYMLILLAFLSALFFVWSIPHTISLREILFFASLAVLLYPAIKEGRLRLLKDSALKPLRAPLYLYAGLTVWILLGAFFLSDNPMYTLSEIKSEWLMGILAAILGVLTALSATAPPVKNNALSGAKAVILSLFFMLALHVLILDAYAFYALFDTGVFPAGERHRLKVLLAPDRMNYISILALAMLLSETLHRIIKGKRFLPLGPLLIIPAYGLVFLSIYIEGFRFGTITAGALMVAGVAIFFAARKGSGLKNRKTVFAIVTLFVVLAALAYSSVISDRRWGTLKETISQALDPETNERWLYQERFKRPRLEDGSRSNDSNFYRALYLNQGLKLVADYPLGLGFSRDSFSNALMKRYGVEKTGHTHSGLLDFALGVGIPGAIFWCALLLSLIIISYARIKKTGSYPALFLFFISIGFTIRMITDSIIRDDMLQWFAFLAALSALTAFTEGGKKDGDNIDVT